MHVLLEGPIRTRNRTVQKALDLDPNFAIARLYRSEAYAIAGRAQEALAECQKVSQLDRSPTTLGVIGRVYAMSGKTGEAQSVLNELKEMSGQTSRQEDTYSRPRGQTRQRYRQVH